MKKSILSLITLSLVAALGLTSCDLPEEDEELDSDASGDTSVTISINNLNSFYLPSETISWEEVSLTLDFTDSATSDVTLTKGAFDVEELDDGDEFILYTSGLYTLSNIEGEDIPEGDYPISYYLVYDEVEYSGSLFSVTITADPSEIYSVFEFNEPEFALKYKDNLAQVNEEGGSENEDKFFKAPLYYEVGNDNPFIYKPELILWDKRGTSFTFETVDSYSATATVTRLVEGEEEDVNLSSNKYVSYSNFAFDFTEEAVGEVFTLSISLNNFTSDINSNPIPPYSFTVRVEEGYNVYNAIDLGRMSLFDEENHKADEGETLSASDFEYGESYYNIFYEVNEETGEPTYVRKSYPDIWKSFYEEKGVVDASEVKGLFIHDDITITENDLPSEFLISAEEAVTMAGQGADFDDMVGSIRDGVIIYNHLMDTEDFTLNGNLFTIDASTLKWCLTRVKTGSADRNGDIEGTALDFYAEQSAELQVSEGTATLFAFDGYKMEWSNTNAGIILEPKATAYVSNLEVNGNMEGNGNTYTDEAMIGQLASGTITFCKSVCAQSEVENVISKHFLTAYYAEKTTSSWTCFDVDHAKIYDCYGVAFVIYVSGDNFVDNSEIKRFGGPVALMFCAEDEEGYFKGYNYAGFTMGENVVAETPLAGDEAWFQIYGLSEYLTLFGAFDAFFAGGNGLGVVIDDLMGLGGLASGLVTCTDYGKTMLDEDGKFNLLSFGMERHTTGSKLYMDFSYGDVTAKIDPDLTIENTSSLTKEDFSDYETVASIFYGNSSYCNATLSALGIINITLPLPLFMTNTGKIFTPSFTGFLSFTGSLFDVSEWLYEIEVEGKTTSTASKNEVEFTEEDTMVFMYYPLDLTDLGADFNITFAMSMSLYDKPSENQ